MAYYSYCARIIRTIISSTIRSIFVNLLYICIYIYYYYSLFLLILAFLWFFLYFCDLGHKNYKCSSVLFLQLMKHLFRIFILHINRYGVGNMIVSVFAINSIWGIIDNVMKKFTLVTISFLMLEKNIHFL